MDPGHSEDAAIPPALVTEEVVFADGPLVLLRPADPAALLDEEAFGEDEFLPYWAELWPAARALANALPTDLSGSRVVELGCGLGLPSLLAARRGATVCATDWAEEALALLGDNARRNKVRLSCARVDWRRPADLLARGLFDLVLAADVLYEERNVRPLLELCVRLGAEVLLADPGRRHATEFLDGARAHFSLAHAGALVHRLTPRGSRPRVARPSRLEPRPVARSARRVVD